MTVLRLAGFCALRGDRGHEPLWERHDKPVTLTLAGPDGPVAVLICGSCGSCFVRNLTMNDAPFTVAAVGELEAPVQEPPLGSKYRVQTGDKVLVAKLKSWKATFERDGSWTYVCRDAKVAQSFIDVCKSLGATPELVK